MNKPSMNEVVAWKTFHAAAATYILGEKSNVKFRGSSKRIKVTQNALKASRDLYEELNNPKASLKSVTRLLENKRRASTEFKQVTGTSWLL
jgi:hypothetical protein